MSYMQELDRLFLPLIPLIDRLLKVSIIEARILPPTHTVLREVAWSH